MHHTVAVNAERALLADGEERLEERICERCSQPYQEIFNIGRWLCGAHIPGARLARLEPSDPIPRWSCCGLTDTPLVEHVRTGLPPQMLQPPPHRLHVFYAGCVPVDHDQDPVLPGQARPVAAVRAWLAPLIALAQESAVVSGPPSEVARALGPGAFDDDRDREQFWTLALWDVQFYEFAARQWPVKASGRPAWLARMLRLPNFTALRYMPDSADIWLAEVRVFLAGHRRPLTWRVPPLIAGLDPVAEGLIVAIWRAGPGTSLETMTWASTAWQWAIQTTPFLVHS